MKFCLKSFVGIGAELSGSSRSLPEFPHATANRAQQTSFGLIRMRQQIQNERIIIKKTTTPHRRTRSTCKDYGRWFLKVKSCVSGRFPGRKKQRLPCIFRVRVCLCVCVFSCVIMLKIDSGFWRV